MEKTETPASTHNQLRSFRDRQVQMAKLASQARLDHVDCPESMDHKGRRGGKALKGMQARWERRDCPALLDQSANPERMATKEFAPHIAQWMAAFSLWNHRNGSSKIKKNEAFSLPPLQNFPHFPIKNLY